MPTKTATPKIPQTLVEADHDVQQLAQLKREMDAIEADRRIRLAPIEEEIRPLLEEMAEINASADGQLKPLSARYEPLEEDVIKFLRRNWKKLAGTKKLFQFPSGGQAKRHKGKETLKVSGKLEVIIDHLKNRGHEEFIRVEETLKKDELKAHPDIISETPGLSTTQKETYTVVPIGPAD